MLTSLIWWIILIFNTFPKKFYYQNHSITTSDSVIVVLTGGKGRIEKGVELFDQNYADYLFISGVFSESEYEIRNELGIRSDFKNCCIIFDKVATNTIENAKEVKKWLINKPGIKNLIVVSSYYHLPRSYITFRNVIEDRNIVLIPSESNIKFNENYLFHIKIIFKEFFKIIFTIFYI